MAFNALETGTDADLVKPYKLGLQIFFNPLFWVCLAMAGSAYRSLRFELEGMAFHPYMLGLGVLIFRTIPRIHQFPGRIGRPGALFLVLYILSLIQGNSFIVHLVKISVMMVTFVLIALSVRSFDDFFAGSLGLGACAAVLCIRGLIREPTSMGSINPIEGSQKNAFSLFYLPGLTLCFYLIFSRFISTNWKVVLASMITVLFAGITLSKNRSGWLSAGAMVFLLLSTNRQRIRILVFVAVVAVIALVLADYAASEAEITYERDANLEAQSDNLRIQLFRRAVSIGLQNPLLGVSPWHLTRMLGKIEKVADEGIDCHNLFGYIIGGSGLFTFGAFCLFAYAMVRPPRRARLPSATKMMRESARILTIITLIWLLRAQFQEDVLFSPTFTSGLGLCVGFCICTGVYGKLSGNQELVLNGEKQYEEEGNWSARVSGPNELQSDDDRPIYQSR
jgi:O-antigen ligase